MDLVEIIKRKNATPTDALDIIKQLITDIITYEKLAQMAISRYSKPSRGKTVSKLT